MPLSHPFVERLIEIIRREFLNHVLFWNSVDLESKLQEFAHYYNRYRVHASLGGDAPAQVCGLDARCNIDETLPAFAPNPSRPSDGRVVWITVRDKTAKEIGFRAELPIRQAQDQYLERS